MLTAEGLVFITVSLLQKARMSDHAAAFPQFPPGNSRDANHFSSTHLTRLRIGTIVKRRASFFSRYWIHPSLIFSFVICNKRRFNERILISLLALTPRSIYLCRVIVIDHQNQMVHLKLQGPAAHHHTINKTAAPCKDEAFGIIWRSLDSFWNPQMALSIVSPNVSYYPGGPVSK